MKVVWTVNEISSWKLWWLKGLQIKALLCVHWLWVVQWGVRNCFLPGSVCSRVICRKSCNFIFQCSCCKLKKVPFPIRASGMCPLECGDLNNIHFEKYKCFSLFSLLLLPLPLSGILKITLSKALYGLKIRMSKLFLSLCLCSRNNWFFFLNFSGHSNKKKISPHCCHYCTYFLKQFHKPHHGTVQLAVLILKELLRKYHTRLLFFTSHR